MPTQQTQRRSQPCWPAAQHPNPLSRYDGPEQFAHDLREALGHGSGEPLAAAIENPYVGLQAFQERDAGRFFGRERLVERLVARLGHTGAQGRLVVLVGPSGAGKSSVVRAGVLPAIRRDAIGDADQWFQATMTPGNDPFAALALALRSVAVEDVPGLPEHLRLEGIAAPTARLLPDTMLASSFWSTSSRNCSPTRRPTMPTRSSMPWPRWPTTRTRPSRSSPRCAPITTTARCVTTRSVSCFAHGSELITPMTPPNSNRRRLRPRAAAGVTFEAGLVPEIVADVMGQASALPLLQHAMTELFERRAGSIDRPRPTGIGGVTGALVQTAEHVYDGFDRRGPTQIRDVFLRLVTLGDGTPDTRRRVLVNELTGPRRVTFPRSSRRSGDTACSASTTIR